MYRLLLVALIFYFGYVTPQKCPNHWIQRPGSTSCYRFWASVRRTWQQSRDVCLIAGGDLLKFESVEEKNFVISQISQYPASTEWWIGLKRAPENETLWQWTDGSTRIKSYIMWGSGEPNNYRDDEDCAEIWDNLLNDKNCNQPLQSVCERSIDTPVLCDSERGWSHLYPGSCYKYFPEPQTMEEATNTCGSDFSKMLTLRNESDHKTLSEFLQEQNNAITWVNMTGDGSNLEVEKMILKLDKNNTEGDCLLLNSTYEPPQNLLNMSCDARHPFFCMKNEGECSVPESLQFESTCVVIETGKTLTWSDADSYCNLRGMKLLEVTSKYMLLFLQRKMDLIVGPDSRKFFWLNFRGSNNDTAWLSGTKFGSFETAIMKNVTGTGCAAMSFTSNSWQLSACDGVNNFICTILYSQTPEEISTDGPRYECPDGYVVFGNKCFLLRYDNLDWFSARQACQREGGSLASVHSVEEYKALFSMIKERTWIGLSDTQEEGIFVWANSGQKPIETYWLQTEPTGQNIGGRYAENCVAMVSSPGSVDHGRWEDSPCLYTRPFICQTFAEYNIAPGKVATQSSSKSSSNGPENAIKTSLTRNSEFNCAITQSEFQPWWQLDLGSDYPIGKVVIRPVSDRACVLCKTLFRDFKLFVSNTSELTNDSQLVFQNTNLRPLPIISIPLSTYVRGRYIRIQIPDRTEILAICGVSVYPASMQSLENITEDAANCYSNKKPWLVPLSQTVSGRQCQRWMDDKPHRHFFHNRTFPDGSQEAAKNYCRDPDGEGMPWCFTLDPDVEWEFCPVVPCHVKTNEEQTEEDINVCGEGWEVDPGTGTCYLLGDSVLMWADAELMCQLNGGHLAVVGNWGPDSAQNSLTKYFSQAQTSTLWLGIYGTSGPDKWKTTDGTLTFTEPLGELQGIPSSNCVYLDKGDGPKVGNCLKRMPYICQKGGIIITYTSKGDNSFTPIKSQMGKYKFTDSGLKFEFKGQSSAIILIQKDINNVKENTYEITLCSFMNTKSFIKVGSDTPTSSSIRNLCSDQEYQPFWIQWSDGVIQVGKGVETLKNVFLNYRPTTEQADVYQFVSIRTDAGKEGKWRIKQENPVVTVAKSEEVNLALKKPVTGSPYYSDFSPPSKVVDGCNTSVYSSGCCFHSAYVDQPWWQVDLGQSYPIKKVVIFRRLDCETCKKRLKNFRLFISELSYSTAASDVVFTGLQLTDNVLFIDTLGKRGRYVKIDIPDRTEFLELCEVQVLLDQDASRCGADWKNHLSTDICYMFNTNKMSWHDARTFCKAHMADLALIQSVEEELFVFEETEKLKNRQSFAEGFWLGYHDLGTEGKFQSVDGSTISFTDWAPGEPNDWGNGEDCSAIRVDASKKSGKWNDSPCSRAMSFICKKRVDSSTTVPVPQTTITTSTSPSTTPFVPSNASCPDGWSKIDGSNACYQVNLEPVTFYDAYMNCLQKQSRLTDIPATLYQPFKDYLKAEPQIAGKKWLPQDGLFTAGMLRYRAGFTNKPTWSWWLYQGQWNTQWDGDIRQDLGTLKEYCSVVSLKPDNLGNLVDFPCSISFAKGYVCKMIPDDVQCEKDWYLDHRTKSCYKLSEDSLPWDQANKKCAQMHSATLATLRNKEDIYFLSVILHSGPDAWIGGHDQFNEGTWEWVDMTPWSSDMPWAQGQPDNWRTLEHCLMVLKKQNSPEQTQLNDQVCTNSLRYICKKGATKLLATTLSVPSASKPSVTATVPTTVADLTPITTKSLTTTIDLPGARKWTRIVEDFYALYDPNRVTWKEARRTCLDYGGDLASIDNLLQAIAIVSFVYAFPGRLDSHWIGLNSLEETGSWHWSDGSPLAFFEWGSGYPLNLDEHHCVSRTHQNWIDENCDNLNGFICTKKERILPPAAVNQTASLTCPSHEWLRFRDSCYLFVQEEVTWTSAQTKCHTRNSQLVHISDMAEETFVYSHLPHSSFCSNLHDNDTECTQWAKEGECDNNPKWMATNCLQSCQLCMHNCTDRHENPKECMTWMKQGECRRNPRWMLPNCAESCGLCQKAPNRGFWIGLRSNNHLYTWESDQPVLFTFWDARQPVSYGRSDYCSAMFLANGKWNDGPCDDLLPGYVCRSDAADYGLKTTPATETNKCLDYLDGFCIQVASTLVSYTQAVEWCSGLGGSLPHDWQASFLLNYGKPDTEKWVQKKKVHSDCMVVVHSAVHRLQMTTNCDMNAVAVCLVPVFPTERTVTTTTVSTVPQTCAPNWALFNSYCYRTFKEVEDKVQWHEAKKRCEVMGATLVSVHRPDERDFILSKMQTEYFSLPAFWIGLHRASDDLSTDAEVFEWVDGSPNDFDWWKHSEPNNFGGEEDCVVMTKYYWNDVPCHQSRQYVCKAPLGKPVSDPPSPFVYETCDFGPHWYQYNTSCYHIQSESFLSWKAAQDTCRRLGAELASIHSEEERIFLLGWLHSQFEVWHDTWLGYNDFSMEGTWRWSDGTASNYVRWHPGEPDSQRFSKRCTTFSEAGMFKDTPCREEHFTLCKKPNGESESAITSTPVTDNVPRGCPPDFQTFGTKCYYIGMTPVTFEEAATMCNNRHSILTSIHSQQEADFLYVFASSQLMVQDLSYWWIGLEHNTYGSLDHWYDNSEIGFTRWKEGSIPIFDYYVYEESRCGVMAAADGYWDMVNCNSSQHGFICRRPPAPEYADITTTLDPLKQCPAGYSNIGYNCLRYVTSVQSWDRSRIICQQDGADLATFNNPIELSQLRLAITTASESIWFGGNFTLVDGFHWITGGSLKVPVTWTDTFSDGFMFYDLNGIFSTADGSFNKTALCMIRKKNPEIEGPTSSTLTTSGVHYDCQSDMIGFQGNCYLVVLNERKTFAEAILACDARGMMVASIHSSAENKALSAYALAQKQSLEDMFIGLRKHKNTPALWLDGTPFDFNPTVMGSEENPCVVMSALSYYWYHASCWQRLGYICKGQPDVLVTTKRRQQPTTMKRPYSGGSTDKLENVSSTGGEESSLTGGQVAGIVVGVIFLVAIIVVVLYVVRLALLRRALYTPEKQSLGFDNALFQKNDDAVALN